MKCLCGYEYEEEKKQILGFAGWYTQKNVTKGDTPFIEINSLYACPKCGTVKINLGEVKTE